jgi:hypothetical protein
MESERQFVQRDVFPDRMALSPFCFLNCSSQIKDDDVSAFSTHDLILVRILPAWKRARHHPSQFQTINQFDVVLRRKFTAASATLLVVTTTPASAFSVTIAE